MDAWWNALSEAYLDLNTGPKIREAGLSIIGVNVLCKVLNDVIAGGRAYTIYQSVARWCELRPELAVTYIGEKSGWYIERRKHEQRISWGSLRTLHV